MRKVDHLGYAPKFVDDERRKPPDLSYQGDFVAEIVQKLRDGVVLTISPRYYRRLTYALGQLPSDERPAFAARRNDDEKTMTLVPKVLASPVRYENLHGSIQRYKDVY
jgi:hypothetical protein